VHLPTMVPLEDMIDRRDEHDMRQQRHSSCKSGLRLHETGHVAQAADQRLSGQGATATSLVGRQLTAEAKDCRRTLLCRVESRGSSRPT
jgi:hypothetical protein